MNRTNLILAAVMLTACSASAQTAINETRPAEAAGVIEVSNTKGPITISGTDANEVKVTGTLGKGSERVDVTGSGPRITVAVVIPEDNEDVEATELNLGVPKGSSVEVDSLNGIIQITGVSGRINVDGVNGSITVTDAKGETYLKTVNGKISLTGSSAETEANTINGSIDIKGVTGRVNASTISGAVTIEGEGLKRLSSKTVRGDILFVGSVTDDATVDLTSQRGGINLRLPETSSASFELSTFSGAIKSTLAKSATNGAEKAGPRKTLQFSTGTGSASIRAKTFGGSITVEKK